MGRVTKAVAHLQIEEVDDKISELESYMRQGTDIIRLIDKRT